jgi:hypothetical protein
MPQRLSGYFQLLAQLLFVQRLTYSHGQTSDMFSFNVIESAIGSQLRDGLISHGRGDEKQGNLLQLLMEDLQRPGAFQTWTRILGNDNVVRLRAKALGTLCQIQNEISAHNELRLFQLFQAVVHHLCIAVDEKDAHGAASVGAAFCPGVRYIRLQIGLG